MIFSLIGAPGTDESAGKRDVAGTSFLPGRANDGGRWYEELRKNESHD